MRIALLIALLLSSLSAYSEPLAPFAAEFRIYVNKLPTPVKADLVLEPAGKPDYYHMLLKAKSFLLTNKEESYFYWNDCQPRTDRYVHEFDGFGQHRYHHMQFQWDPPRVHNESEDDAASMDIADDTLDELTILLRGRCVFATGDKEYTVTSAYGDDLRTHHFVVIDREKIDTPLGKVDTLVVENRRTGDSKKKRRTLFWVAPDLDYMVVKAKHIESTFLKAEMIMIDYHGPTLEERAAAAEDQAKKTRPGAE
ncbi:hypothetical protein A11A3_05956 [Alcanivorax hongdengensis A-11-3]|uniref:DUF3108 domain-containing protein n=2 Tax=Alcanivorax hongdengensis TaxID=519051 RepID=L0WE29_9GAMM|nr:hypothetical protein A11A3_05956 [Alcanivorax hongdengensis A-11-3]